jgi:carbonic anhydrase
MKNSILIPIIGFLIISACNNNQEAEPKQVDSLQNQTESKEQADQQMVQNLTRAGDIVKAEAPDAEVKFEQGYALPRTNDGIAQSPINIITTGVEPNSKQHNDLKFTGSINAIENLGHTIQVDFTSGSATLVDGKSYDLKQLHFHTPSEHLIDGVTYPLEMHIVSMLNDSVKNEGSKYTVMGILFKMGRENKFLKEFINFIPKEEGKDTLDPSKVKLNDLFAEFSGGEKLIEYKYQGSLTTPPYTESVNWVIARRIFEASEDQIARIEKIEGNNARHIRALNNRKIKLE